MLLENSFQAIAVGPFPPNLTLLPLSSVSYTQIWELVHSVYFSAVSV